MAFWTSREPGELPKWIFWFYMLQVPLFLYLTTLEKRASIAAGGVLGLAILARRNEIGFLSLLHILAVISGLYLLWTSSKLWPDYLENKGWSTDGVLVTMVYGLAWIWYLNRCRLKGDSPSLPPSTPELNNLAEGVEATAPGQAASVETDNASNYDYAIELKLYEGGDLDQSLWAKHLVESEGDADKAKWKYIKERVATAPARRLHEKQSAEREAEADVQAIHQSRVYSYVEEEQAGQASKPGGIGCLGQLTVGVVIVLLCIWAIALLPRYV